MSSSVTCHLARGDGSRWIVTSYDRDARGVTVCAVRELDARSGDAAPPGEGDARRDALWRTRLREDDRLEWRGVDGRVLASSDAGPVAGPGESSDG